MEQNEIVEIVTKTIKEMKDADELANLRKDYETLKADVAKSVEPKVEVEPENVEKSLTEQVAELTATIEKMKTTGIQKGAQDGEVIEKGVKEPDTIAGQMIAKYYGGN